MLKALMFWKGDTAIMSIKMGNKLMGFLNIHTIWGVTESK